MPLLMHLNPVAGRALAWRNRGRDSGAGGGFSPLAAVRHLFRDHSSSASGVASDGHRGDPHPLRHPHHRHPHHRKGGKELSSDWNTLYLGAKLAHWSGLCYLPYDTIPQALQEEGLQLVAYGRTSYTCWYVADGYLDLEVLRRRAAAQRQQPPTTPTPTPTRQQEATLPKEQRLQPGGPKPPSPPSSTPPLAFLSQDGGASYPSHVAAAAASLGPAPSGGGGAASPASGLPWSHASSGVAAPSPADSPADLTKATSGDARAGGGGGIAAGGPPAGRSDPHQQPESRDGQAHPHTHTHTHSHAHHHSGQGHGAQAAGQGAAARQGSGLGHWALRNGHLHLEQPPHPPLHPHLRRHSGQHPAGDDSGGGGGASGPVSWLRPSSPVAAAAGTGARCRFIFLRGVQWAAHDTNTLSLSASLAAFWPSPLLAPDLSTTTAASASAAVAATATASSSSSITGFNAVSFGSSGVGSSSGSVSGSSPAGVAIGTEELVAHSGVGAMARELLPVLLPYIRGADAAGAEHLVLAGHSLGGSLAKLLWAMSLMQGHRSPEATSCHTFGSPPVLAHTAGGGGARVLRLLRAPPSSVINWVLEHDPVPRAMLTADPYFAAACQAVPGLSALLALRGAVLGEGATLSSGRFLYETVGELLLLRWASKGGCEVVPVSEAEADSLLRMALDEAVSSPVRTLQVAAQYWLDHHHASYHHDLEAAALAACRREERRAERERQGQHQGQPGQEDQEQRGLQASTGASAAEGEGLPGRPTAS